MIDGKFPKHFLVGREDGELHVMSSDPHILHCIHRKAQKLMGTYTGKDNWIMKPVADCWEEGKTGFDTVLPMKELEMILQVFGLKEN